MKISLFYLLAFLLLTTGCIKEKSEEEKENASFFMRFRANGVLKEYTQYVQAIRSQAGTDNMLTVLGQQEASAAAPGLAVVIVQEQPITAQTYTDTTSDRTGLLYRDDTAVDYSSLFLTSDSGLEIVLSDIGQTTVQGTFKGRVADTTGTLVEITEGAFFAKFQ